MKQFLYLMSLGILFCCVKAQSQNILTEGIKLERRIGATDLHLYQLKIQKGEFLKIVVLQKGIDLEIIVRFDGVKELKTFDAPNGANGPELIEIVAPVSGIVSLSIKPLDTASSAKPGEYTLEYQQHLTKKEFEKVVEKRNIERQEIIQWVKNNSHVIKTIVPGSAFDDLQTFKDRFEGKLVIGLGEATHGTKEFFQVKHRVVEFLVKEMGFSVFGLEAKYERCKYINEYILFGKGNLDTAVSIQGFDIWRVDEMRQLISWMRDYNATGPANKIKFVGFDMQHNDAEASVISEYYTKVDPNKSAEIDSILTKIIACERRGGAMAGDTSARKWVKIFEKVMSDFVDRQGQYILRSSKQEFEQTLMCHSIIHQFLSTMTFNNYTEPVKKEDRDFYMAQNALTWLTQFPEGTKMILWAHNGHIRKDYLDGESIPSMGNYLKKSLKEKYYSIGLDFYEGSFSGYDADSIYKKGIYQWREFDSVVTLENALGYYFRTAGLDKCFLDLKKTQTLGVIDNWLAKQNTGMHSIGFLFSKNWPVSNYTSQVKLSEAYDGIIFINKTTGTRLLKKSDKLYKYKVF